MVSGLNPLLSAFSNYILETRFADESVNRIKEIKYLTFLILGLNYSFT